VTDRIDTILTLKHSHSTYQVECPLLAAIAPEVYFAKRWDCGPRTFDFLLDFLLDSRPEVDDDARKEAVQRVLDGKWELHYRDAPIYRGDTTPEDKLWPA
jgi:hypothetical protein